VVNLSPLFSNNGHHPVVMMPADGSGPEEPRARLGAEAPKLRELLQRHGGVLLRGWGLNGAQDFRACAASLGATPFGYVGGNTPRTAVAADVFTSTEYPASEVIGLHHEMSYLPSWPRRLFFYCVIPAARGGQTSLADSRDVRRMLPARLVDRLREKGITYIRHFHPDLPIAKSWQATYQTDDRGAVERTIEAQGSTCTWLDGDVLRVTTRCDALVTHPVTGEELWFNQAEHWHPSALPPGVREMCEELVGGDRMPHDCRYGDGTPLEEETLTEIRDALQASKLLFDWQPHDLLMIDNLLMMHGREPFTGERKTLAYLSAT
jgi:alpha-ketoglutarate-dependent taurine dioxygenase